MATMAERLGGRIREAREARGLSLRGLAEGARLDFGYVGKVERGAEASLTVYERLARALGVSEEELFSAHRASRAASAPSRGSRKPLSRGRVDMPRGRQPSGRSVRHGRSLQHPKA